MFAYRTIAVGAAIVSLGCGASTPEAKYGTLARYAQDYGAYVITRSRQDGAAAEGADVLVLREPLSDLKLRCREQLLEWLPAQEKGLGDNVRAEYDANRSLVIMLPIAAPALVLAGGATILATVSIPFFGAAELPHLMSGYPSAARYYERGLAAFRSKRYAESRGALLTSIAMDPERARTSYELYYIGLAYEQERRPDLAVRALTAFFERAAIVDAGVYRQTETVLERLGAPLPRCASQDPVAVMWTP